MPNARKGGSIILYDYEGSAVMRYNFTNAMGQELEPSDDGATTAAC